MRKNVCGLIYAGEENLNLRELVNKRSVGALPVGSRYRAIDFVLSNMVNSGIRNIGVIPRRNYHSMMDHLGSGKEWDLNRKEDGLIIIPPYDTSENYGSHHGQIDTLQGAAPFLRRAPQKYCLLASTSAIYTDTYNKMFDFHVESGADITLLYTEETSSGATLDRFADVRFETDEEGRIINMKTHGTAGANHKMSLGAYLIKKDLLQYLLDDAASRGKYNIDIDIIMSNLDRLKIYAFAHKGYVGHLRSVASYFKTNMDFLKENVQKDLFESGNKVYTKIKDEAPTRYGKDAVVKNSLIGSGCTIEGEVENCIVFRDVTIAKGTVVKDSIIMQSSEIYADSRLTNVILDKKVTVRPSSMLAGSREYPVIIPKGANV